MKKTIILSALTALTLTTANADIFLGTFKMKEMPMDQKYLSIERGGTLTAAQAYSDGVGVIVIGNTSATTPDNTPMNTLVEKYGEAAADKGEPLYAYVLNNANATVADKALAQQLQNDLANSTVAPKCVTKSELQAMIANDEDYSNVCTSNITDFSYLFYNKTVKHDISGWNVSNATNLTGMFHKATFVNAQNLNWDVSNVTNMTRMFAYSNFNGDISGWNVSKVTSFYEMFRDNTAFNQDLSGWVLNTSQNISMTRMFAYSNFNGDISGWNVSKVTSFYEIFRDNTAFNRDLSGWTPPAGASNTRFDQGATNWTLPKPTFN